jgi:hypothetical protein
LLTVGSAKCLKGPLPISLKKELVYLQYIFFSSLLLLEDEWSELFSLVDVSEIPDFLIPHHSVRKKVHNFSGYAKNTKGKHYE